MGEEEFRQRVTEMIVAIIRSGASERRMTEMLANVHRVERWPAMRVELAVLDREGGG